MRKFKDNYLRLVILLIGSLCLGLPMLVAPQKTPNYIIFMAGIVFLFESIGYVLEMIKKFLEEQVKKDEQ